MRNIINMVSINFLFNKIRWIPDKLLEIGCYFRLLTGFVPKRSIEVSSEEKIIVSLTSWKGRIKYVPATLVSLLCQTQRPHKIILYLSKEELSEDDIGFWLKKCCGLGVEICFVDGPNIKSHKKYYYAMREYPQNIVITVDDDVIYRKDLIESLFKAHLKQPETVVTLGASEITFDDYGNINSYKNWNHGSQVKSTNPSYLLFPIGVSGVLYPPNSISELGFDIDRIISLCPTHDDLWLKVMGLLNNRRVFLAGGYNVKSGVQIRGSQRGLALGIINLANDCYENDKQFRNVIEAYNDCVEGETIIQKIINDKKKGNI